ncbi:MAG: hypothetical protein PHV11_07635 [Candidatus Bipolaricaulis sp.]|nr:hypothetical protein [Candidatus Bipolaricaulis sp.]
MITVFSKQWFKKYSKQITWLARLPFVGEFVFNFKKFGHYVDRNKIVEVTPNSVIEFVAWKKGYKEVELRQHFFVRNEYALRLQSVFYPIWITFHIWDIITRPIPQLNLGFDTLTVYPDVDNPGTDSVDAFINSGAQAYWSTCRNLTTGTVVNNTYGTLAASTYLNPSYYITRGFETYKTSGLPDDATISSAVLSNYGYGSSGNAIVHIVSSSQATANEVVGTDFNDIGSTSFGSYSYSTWSTIAYNDCSLNASGIANISKTGISKFAFREEHDLNNSSPNNFYILLAYYSDNGSNKPKLVVTYTTVVGPANVKTYKGLASASVKTCKGLLIASCKTKKGLN